MFNEKKNTKEEFEIQYSPTKIYLIVDVHCVTLISTDMSKQYRKLTFVGLIIPAAIKFSYVPTRS